MEVNNLEDRLAIADQLGRYSLTFDAHDAEGWARLFTDDGVFEVRMGAGPDAVFRAEGAEQLRAFASSAPRLIHHISGLVFDELLEGRALTRAVVLGTWTSPEGEPSVYTHGSYEQVWTKADGTWRLAQQVFRSQGYHRAAFQAPSQ